MNAKEHFDQLFKRFAELTDQARQSEEMTRWLSTLAKFHRYSFGNIMLIASQRPDATQVAGIKTWNKLGRRVKKGEKGIKILVPVLVKKKNEDEDEVDDEVDDEDNVLFFRTGYVFDISQTEGEPLPNEPKWWSDGDAPAELLERIVTAIEADGIAVRIVEKTIAGGDARGVSIGGLIQVIQDATPLSRASTLIHEWAHEIRRRNPDDAQPREVEEVIVEAVAYAVLAHYGLNPKNNATYVALWQGGKDYLRQNMKIIKRLVSEIIEKIERVSEKVVA